MTVQAGDFDKIFPEKNNLILVGKPVERRRRKAKELLIKAFCKIKFFAAKS